jgi:hypothetical protein
MVPAAGHIGDCGIGGSDNSEHNLLVTGEDMSAETRLDVRLPIGAMFVLVGAIISIFGLVSDRQIYERSLGININLWWGLVMFAFGGFMLIMARRSSRAAKGTEKHDTN